MSANDDPHGDYTVHIHECKYIAYDIDMFVYVCVNILDHVIIFFYVSVVLVCEINSIQFNSISGNNLLSPILSLELGQTGTRNP